MRIRPDIVVSAVLGGLALGWAVLIYNPKEGMEAPLGPVTRAADEPAQQVEARGPSERRPAPPASTSPSDTVVFEGDARAQFNDKAREFFARAPALSAEERQRQAQQIEQELSLLERAGGLSAGETFLVRTGLIRETVDDPVEQAAKLKALQQNYQNESNRRLAQASAQQDPAFESYKIRESQIVAEVMALQTIPDGLTRDEYLRRRLQAAREQLMSNPSP